jgi:farnesyl diphosphate synthase
MREAVEAALHAALPPEAAWPATIHRAVRYSLMGGGKRIRPTLVLAAGEAVGGARVDLMPLACAVEMIHTYSLIHDDLPAMDDDEVRRGQPTVWKAFDEWTAILAGDALATLAFEILAGTECHPDPLVRSELALGLARAAGHAGMIGGQALDLEADKRGEPARPTVDHVRRLQAMKTGALIAFAAEAGAILGRADAERRRALAAYGRSLGLAFQIADDLLDVEGDAETVGKAVAKDAHRGKATLISLMGIEPARKLLGEAEAEAIAALAPFGADARWLVEAARFVSRRRH